MPSRQPYTVMINQLPGELVTCIYGTYLLKAESHHDANFIVTAGKGGCQNGSDGKVGIMTTHSFQYCTYGNPDNKIHGANMGPSWGQPGPCRPRWAPCRSHEPCSLGTLPINLSNIQDSDESGRDIIEGCMILTPEQKAWLEENNDEIIHSIHDTERMLSSRGHGEEHDTSHRRKRKISNIPNERWRKFPIIYKFDGKHSKSYTDTTNNHRAKISSTGRDRCSKIVYHVDQIVVNGCTGSCHFYIFRWWQFC